MTVQTAAPQPKKSIADHIAERSPKIATFLRLMFAPGDVFEVRGLEVGEYQQTYAGFFNDYEKAAEAIARLDLTQCPRGIYVTINPLQNELLHRLNNRITKSKRGEMASNKHVTRRRWLFIDIDPERAGGITGIPASQDEKEAAETRSEEVNDWLMQQFGFHEPISMDSGNGRYLIYPIDLPNDDPSTDLIKQVLGSVSSKWSDHLVKIDVTVCNAARIVRCFLTLNRKGDSTTERPHRFCLGLHGPDYLKDGWAEPIPRTKLEAVAALAPEEKRKEPNTAKGPSSRSNHAEQQNGFLHRLKVAEWLSSRSIEFQPSHILTDGRECWPVTCVFDANHGRDASFMQSPDGKMAFKCFHDGCSSNGWQEAKERVGKPSGEHYDPPMSHSSNGATGLKPNESGDDPHRLARIFIEERYTKAGGLRTIVFFQGEWWFWNGAAYVSLQKHSLTGELTASIKKEFDRINLWELENFEPTDKNPDPPKVRAVTKTHLNNTENAAASLSLVSDRSVMPCWLGTSQPFPSREVLATRRNLLHLPSLVAGKKADISPTPEFFSSVCLDFDYDENATCPTLISLLKSIWRNDQQSIDTLQEFIGYLLVWDSSQHKMLLLIGPTRSGKGTLARMLLKLLGEGNVASPTLSNLGGSFGLWPLLNKSVAIVPDARLSGREDSTLIVERLLSLTGQDPQDIHRKCQSTLTGVRMPIRFLLMSNELPNFKDVSGAFMSRVLLLQMTESFLGREDRTLDAKLQQELPGILNWAIQGWKRLTERGYFIQPDSANQLLDEFANLSSPIRQFIADRCIVDPYHEVSTNWLFAAWNAWCKDNGRDHAGTAQAFGRDLRAAVPQITTRQPRTEAGRERFYVGIGLKNTDYQ